MASALQKIVELRRLTGETYGVKTLTRILLVAALAGVIYFATIGRNDFYAVVNFFYDLIQLIANNYLKK
jgi:hypothetical protein